MIIKPHPKKGTGRKRASHFSDYLLNPEGRISKPIQILGPDRRVFDAAGEGYALTTVNPVTTFDIGFLELLEPPQAEMIIREIHEEFTVGLDPVDVMAIAGLHAKLDHDDRASSDMHYGLVNKLITTGVGWNPYNKESHRGWLTALTETINDRHNLASPKDPSRQRLVSFPNDRYDPPHIEELKSAFTEAVRLKHTAQPFQTKADFLSFVRNSPGVTRAVDRKSCVDVSFNDCQVRMLGLLASNRYFEGKVRPREEREVYERDLEEARERRRKENQALYDSQPRHNILGWAPVYYPLIDDEFDRERELEILSTVEIECVVRHVINHRLDLTLDDHTLEGVPISRYLDLVGGQWSVRPSLPEQARMLPSEAASLAELKAILSAVLNDVQGEKNGRELSRD